MRVFYAKCSVADINVQFSISSIYFAKIVYVENWNATESQYVFRFYNILR